MFVCRGSGSGNVRLRSVWDCQLWVVEMQALGETIGEGMQGKDHYRLQVRLEELQEAVSFRSQFLG